MGRQTRTWESTEKLLSNIISSLSREPGGNNELLADALQVAIYEEFTEFFADWETQIPRTTSTGGHLGAMLSGFGVNTGGTSDDDVLRSRLGGRLAVMWNDSTMDGVIRTAMAVTGLAASDFTYVENTDAVTGAYIPAYAELGVQSDALLELGIPVESITEILTTLGTSVNSVAPAGFRINTVLIGGAEWDAANWDDPEELWSS